MKRGFTLVDIIVIIALSLLVGSIIFGHILNIKEKSDRIDAQREVSRVCNGEQTELAVRFTHSKNLAGGEFQMFHLRDHVTKREWLFILSPGDYGKAVIEVTPPLVVAEKENKK